MNRHEIAAYIPFVLDRRAAADAARAYIGTRQPPAAAHDALHPEALRAVYVPFWRFYGTVTCEYQGAWEEEEDYQDSAGGWQTDVNRHYISGTTDYDIDDAVLVCAAADDADTCNELLPYDLSQAESDVPPDADAGDIVPCTITAEAAWQEAKEGLQEYLAARLARELCEDYDTQSAEIHTLNSSYMDISAECLLLPLWEVSFASAGRTHTVYVNGQTGRVYGNLPAAAPRAGCFSMAAVLFLLLIFLH